MSKGREYCGYLAAKIAIRMAWMLVKRDAAYKCEVAGSIRRRLPSVHDIDLVSVPAFTEEEVRKNLFDDPEIVKVPRMPGPLDALCNGAKLFDLIPRGIEGTLARDSEEELLDLHLEPAGKNDPKSWDNGILKYACRGEGRYDGLPLDVYVCSEDRWPLIFLIRTGSAEHNKRLAAKAKHLGMKLHANGIGIEDSTGKIIRIKNDRQLFQILKLRYLHPEERDRTSKLKEQGKREGSCHR